MESLQDLINYQLLCWTEAKEWPCDINDTPKEEPEEWFINRNRKLESLKSSLSNIDIDTLDLPLPKLKNGRPLMPYAHRERLSQNRLTKYDRDYIQEEMSWASENSHVSLTCSIYCYDIHTDVFAV